MIDSQTQSTLIVLATKLESGGHVEKLGFTPLYCGIGPQKAEKNLNQKLHRNSDVRTVVNLGTAASLRHPVGSVIQVREVLRRDDNEVPLLKIDTLDLGYIWGRCGTGAQIATAEEMSRMDAAEMEAYVLADICLKRGMSFICYKVVTDQSGSNVFTEWKAQLPAVQQKWAEVLSRLQAAHQSGK